MSKDSDIARRAVYVLTSVESGLMSTVRRKGEFLDSSLMGSWPLVSLEQMR